MKKKVRLAFFIDNIGWGGAEKSLMSLLHNIDFKDIEVDLYTVSMDSDDPEALSLLPTEVRHLSIPVSGNKFWNRFCRFRYAMKRILYSRFKINRHWAEPYWKSMKRTYSVLDSDYDVAVAYQQGMITYYVAEKVKARKKIAWINSQLSAHGHSVRFSRKFYDVYDHVVTVCDEQRKFLSDSGYVNPSKFTTIYDIIDENDVCIKALEECDIDRSHEWTFVTVARLAPEKNLELAIDAADILRDKGVDFLWLIVGEGPRESSLRERIAERKLSAYVILTGAQKNPYKFMKAADVYVLTSSSEGFGMTIAEAKILGRPVVSTNFPMVYDQIKDGENGLIAEMTAESVADRIIRIISDDALRTAIEKNLAKERNMTKITESKKFMRLVNEKE